MPRYCPEFLGSLHQSEYGINSHHLISQTLYLNLAINQKKLAFRGTLPLTHPELGFVFAPLFSLLSFDSWCQKPITMANNSSNEIMGVKDGEQVP
jgi:hypothetical protein